MYLAEVIFPSTSVIVPTPSLHIHPQNITDTRVPPLRLPYNPKHCVFHLSSDFCHTYYTREFFPNTIYISSENIILFHCSCIVLSCSLFRHHRTRFFLFFNDRVSVFATILMWKPFLLNCLWIDLLQIRTGTGWVNSFIKSRKLLLRSCFTILINAHLPSLLVDLGRHVHGLFSIFSLWSNLDTSNRLNPTIFPICVFKSILV